MRRSEQEWISKRNLVPKVVTLIRNLRINLDNNTESAHYPGEQLFRGNFQ